MTKNRIKRLYTVYCKFEDSPEGIYGILLADDEKIPFCEQIVKSEITFAEAKKICREYLKGQILILKLRLQRIENIEEKEF